jgi:hypothetical protein
MAYCLYCTNSGWRCIDRFPPANVKQGPIPEEISQTLLTNKKQVWLCLLFRPSTYHACPPKPNLEVPLMQLSVKVFDSLQHYCAEIQSMFTYFHPISCRLHKSCYLQPLSLEVFLLNYIQYSYMNSLKGHEVNFCFFDIEDKRQTRSSIVKVEEVCCQLSE